MSGKKLPLAGKGRDPLERLLAGDSADVIAGLRERLAAEPNDEVAWLQLGTAFLHIGHFADAADALGKSVELDGDLLQARRLYATALSRLRRVDEAAFQLVRAKRLAPDDPVVARELGATFYDKRLHDKALIELNRAKELAPEDARTQFALGLVHEAKNDAAAAIAAYREAVRLEPSFIEGRQTLADALASMGELHDAVRELAHAQVLDRANMQIATNLEILKDALGKLERARLLGKGEEALQRAAVVEHGQLKRRGKITAAGEDDVERYGSERVELWRTVDAAGQTRRLMLLLLDPEQAAATSGEAFGVTVVSESGAQVAANYATAITVTFLREALGCPMTTASSLYARLLQGEDGVSWAGAQLGFAAAELAGAEVHGLFVAL